MKARYLDSRRVSGADRERIDNLLRGSFDNPSQLASFVRDSLGRNAHDSVDWNQSMLNICFKLGNHFETHDQIGRLLEQLMNVHPDNQDLRALVARLVESGFLIDTNPGTEHLAPTRSSPTIHLRKETHS